MDAIMGYTYGVIMNTSMGVIAGTIGGLTQILYGLYSGETYTDEEIMEIMATNVFVGAAGGAAFGLVSGPAAGYAAYSGGLSGAMVRGYIGAGIGQGLVLGYLDKMKKDKQTTAIVDMHLRSVYKNVQVLVVCNTWFES